MKALVTGGAGFIGSNIADALLAQGAEVMVIDDFSSGCEANLASALRAHGSRLHISKADIRKEETADIIASYKPDTIFHLAAQMNVRRSVAEPVFDSTVNVCGTVNILESARLNGVKKVMFSSTGGAIYGEQEYFPADEEHPIHAECQYGVSKRCGELYLAYYARAYNLSCTALRFANVYGPRQNPKGEAGVVAIFADRLIKGEHLKVNGDGGQTRDFVYVQDVVKANLAMASRVTPGVFNYFNVGTGIETSINTLAEGCVTAWASLNPGIDRNSIRIEHGAELPGEQRRSVISAKKLEKECGWSPKTQLVEGLEVTIKSFIDNAPQ